MAKRPRRDLPAQGTPGSTVEKHDDSGALNQKRTYGSDGRAEKNIDFGHVHTGVGDPHAHDWDWTLTPPRQPARALRPVKTQDYCTGWMDSSIDQFLKDTGPLPPSMKYALITCLDSGFDVASMLRTSPALQPLKSHATRKGKGVLFSTAKLLAAQQTRRIFHGFDEVWFFPTDDVTAKPTQVCITGPQSLPPEPPAKLVAWMDENKCGLGLGDGAGLNFVAKLKGVAKYLVNQWQASVDGSGSP